jgi:hypothetical protein
MHTLMNLNKIVEKFIDLYKKVFEGLDIIKHEAQNIGEVILLYQKDNRKKFTTYHI